jgi:hypothetical protein
MTVPHMDGTHCTPPVALVHFTHGHQHGRAAQPLILVGTWEVVVHGIANRRLHRLPQ